LGSASEAKQVSLTVFYSWQTDSPPRINRTLIEDALKQALGQINVAAEVVNAARGEEIKLDKDTAGLPGTPPIVETIFRKIDQCAVFVPDLTFVARTKNGRPTPNPNVLIEYGWVLKSRGYERIVAVMNSAYGEPSETDLPFNMRHLRWPIRYTLPAADATRSAVRMRLVDRLAEAIQAVITNGRLDPRPAFEETPSTYDKAVYFQKNEQLAVRPGRITEKDERCSMPATGAKMFLRLIPTNLRNIVSPTQALKMAREGHLAPFSLARIRGGEWYDRNKYGAVVDRGDAPVIFELTQLFKNGEIWGISSKLELFKKQVGYGVVVDGYEDAFVRALDNYRNFAKSTLIAELPLRFIAGLTGIEEFKIQAPRGMTFGGFEKYAGRAVEAHIVFEGTVDWSTPSLEVLRPFFEAVWDTFGLQRPKAPG
jgi:hypothetical protein